MTKRGQLSLRRAPSRFLVVGAAVVLAISVPVGLASGTNTSSSSKTVGVTLTGGCEGQATSYRPNRRPTASVLDKANAPAAPGASSSDPFVVDRGGRIDWSGSTPVAFTHLHWWVDVDGVPALSGTSKNGSHTLSVSGFVRDADIPRWLGLTGVFYVNGQISGTGGTCTGALYLKVMGDPATGPLLWVGIVFVLLGIALLFGARPTWLASFTAVPSGSPFMTRTPSAKREKST